MYLRDRLQEALDIPNIQDLLKYRPSRTSQKLINRVANSFSDKPNTAGSAYATCSTFEESTEEINAYYGLVQRYGGESRKLVKTFAKGGTRGDDPDREKTNLER